MAKQLFGTDGMRGVPGKYPLDGATLLRAGFAFGEYLRSHRNGFRSPRVLIGMDTRESGPAIAASVAQGLLAANIEPVSAGIITTPGVAWLVREENFEAGVVISASHNPYQDNGVKLISSRGMKFPDEAEAEIESRMSAVKKNPTFDARKLPYDALKPSAALHEDYLAALRQKMFHGANLKGMKIVLDCANGAASALGPALFRSLGAEVFPIFDQPNGRNINDGCGSLHSQKMQEETVRRGANLGVAFDGDADRAIFSSPKGRSLDGDAVLFLCSRHMKAAGILKSGTIVGTSMSNLGLEQALAREGLRLARTSVGDRYVLEEMLRIGANLGGEQSGHVIFLDDATTGDGLLTAIKMASLVSLLGLLDALVEELKIFPQKIVNVRVRSREPLESLPQVTRAIADAEKQLGTSGRIVVRYSGTEPLARVMVEAERAEEVERFCASIAAAIRDTIGVS